MSDRGFTLIELTITIMIVGIVSLISIGYINLDAGKLPMFGEELVTDFNLYRSLTAETPGVYQMSFNREGYDILRKSTEGDVIVASKYLPKGLSWIKRPEGILFENDNKLKIIGDNHLMTIEILDEKHMKKAEVTIVPVSNRVTVARYLDM